MSTQSPPRRGLLANVSDNVIALGWVSFCTDLATEMLYPVMPLFLVGTLGASPALLGLIDGLAEGVSSGLRWLGGALSDRFGKRKPFVLMGYSISALSKPAMGLAQMWGGWPVFLGGRVADRLGKSLRTSARDALIADSTDEQHRGLAFGFHRAMDTCGAVLGPLVTLAILIFWTGLAAPFAARWGDHGNAIAKLPLQSLFYFAVIPGLASALLVMSRVREITPASGPKAAGPPPIFQNFGPAFWKLIAANAVFSLGNSSDSFLILRSGELGMGFGAIVLAYVAYNVVYAACSAPLGRWSDRVGRRPVIAIGWTVYAIVYAGFAIWSTAWSPWVLFCAYGLYFAFSEGVAKAMVSDLVGAHQRAGAIGMFYSVSGFCQLFASLLTGLLWSWRPWGAGISPALLIGAVFALAGAGMMAMVPARAK